MKVEARRLGDEAASYGKVMTSSVLLHLLFGGSFCQGVCGWVGAWPFVIFGLGWTALAEELL